MTGLYSRKCPRHSATTRFHTRGPHFAFDLPHMPKKHLRKLPRLWPFRSIIRGRRRLDGATKRARTLETEWHRHPVMVKRRTAFGRLVAAASNLYFRLAGLPI